MFTSTSKITFPGAGVSAIACSDNSMKYMCKRFSVMIISYDKINQLRHVKFFKNVDGIKAHMEKQADLIRPKFELVEKIFSDELASRGIGTWMHPLGGYFISFEAPEGCAKEIVSKCKEAGVVLTGAGSPFPYKKDPKDSVIRIAPTYPSLAELEQAANVFVVVVRMAAAEKFLAEK